MLVRRSLTTYQKRSASRARELLRTFGIEPATTRALEAIHGWGGHMARQPLTSPLGRLLRFRDLNWWKQIQELLPAWGPRNTSSWRHRRPGRHTRWETLLHNNDPNWLSDASSREAWRASLPSFLSYAWNRLGARNVTKNSGKRKNLGNPDPNPCPSKAHRTSVADAQGPGRRAQHQAPEAREAPPANLSLPSLLSNDVASASVWQVSRHLNLRRFLAVCVGHNTDAIFKMLGVTACTDSNARPLRERGARTLKQLARVLHTPWHKLLVGIPEGATLRSQELANLALDDASSKENTYKTPYRCLHDWPCTLKACYSSVVRGDHCAGGVTINMLQNNGESWIEVFSSSLFFGKCRNGLWLRFRPVAVLSSASPLCSPPSPLLPPESSVTWFRYTFLISFEL